MRVDMRVLMSLTLFSLLLAGCYSETSAPPPSAGAPPQPQYQGSDGGEFVIDEDQYFSDALNSPVPLEYSVDVRVTSGPALDIYVLDEVAYQNFEQEGSFLYYPGCSEEGVKVHAGTCTVDSGMIYLVIDNTNRGGTSPPFNGVNDAARVTWSMSYTG